MKPTNFLVLPAFLSALLMLLAPPAEAQSVNARNMLKLARSHAEQGDWEEVKEYAERALKDEPGYVDALYMRAFAFRELEQYEKAEADFKEVIRRNPDYLPTYGGLAEVYLHQEQYEKAEALFVELSKQPHGAPWADYYRGVVAYLRGELEKAERAWKATLAEDADFAPAHHNLGALYLARGEHLKALGKFREALHKKPETPLYRFHIAWALERAGQLQEAQDLLAELAGDSGEDRKTWLLARGLQSLLAKKPQAAVQVLATVAESHPDNLDVWVLLGRAHLALEQPEEARRALEKAKEIDGSFGEVDELLRSLPAQEAPVPAPDPVSPASE